MYSMEELNKNVGWHIVLEVKFTNTRPLENIGSQ